MCDYIMGTPLLHNRYTIALGSALKWTGMKDGISTVLGNNFLSPRHCCLTMRISNKSNCYCHFLNIFKNNERKCRGALKLVLCIRLQWYDEINKLALLILKLFNKHNCSLKCYAKNIRRLDLLEE